MGKVKLRRLVDIFIAKYIFRLEDVHRWQYTKKGKEDVNAYYGAIPGYAREKVIGEWYGKYQGAADKITGYEFYWPIPYYEIKLTIIASFLLLFMSGLIRFSKWLNQK